MSKESYFEEKQSAYLYRVIAKKFSGARQEKVFLALAQKAEEQALHWVKEAAKRGEEIPSEIALSFHAKAAVFLLRFMRPQALKPMLSSLKIRGLTLMDMHFLAHPHHTSPTEIGKRHKTSGFGNNLRAAVFGINDGLVSNSCLILGMAGATADPKLILTTGMAGVLAGALSMASGEYVSVQTTRELLAYQISLEKAELEEYPEEEASELALIYEAKGLEKSQAEAISNALVKNPEVALQTLVREELGMNPDDLGSPVGAAISSFLAFAVGGLVPLLPYVLRIQTETTTTTLKWSLLCTGGALFLTGALMALFSGKNAIFSGIRMVMIGLAAGALTHFIGNFFGTVVS